MTNRPRLDIEIPVQSMGRASPALEQFFRVDRV